MAKKKNSGSRRIESAGNRKSYAKRSTSDSKLAALVARLWPPSLIEMDQADEIIRLILNSDPGNPVALLTLSYLFETPQEQFELLEEALRQFETRRGGTLPGMTAEDVRAATALTRTRLAEITRDSGRLSQAAALFERNHVDKLYGMELFEILVLYIGLRDAGKARQTLERLLQWNSGVVPTSALGLRVLMDLWLSPDSPETSRSLREFVERNGPYVSLLLDHSQSDVSPLDVLGLESPDDISSDPKKMMDAIATAATLQGCWNVWRSIPEAICKLRDEWQEQNPLSPLDPEAPNLDQLLRKARRIKQNADVVWLLDIQQPEAWMQAGGHVNQPWQAIVFELSTKEVIAQKLSIRKPSAEDLTLTLVAGMCGYFVDRKTRPAVVRCRNPLLASWIEAGMTSLGVAVEVSDDFGLLETYLEPTVGMWRGTPEWPAVTEAPDVTDAEVAAFYAAADRFLSVYRSVPLQDVFEIVNLRVGGERGGKQTTYSIVLPEGLYFTMAFEFEVEDREGTFLSVSYGEPHRTRFVDWQYRVHTHPELKPPVRDGFVTLYRFEDEEPQSLSRTDILNATSLLQQTTLVVKTRQQMQSG